MLIEGVDYLGSFHCCWLLDLLLRHPQFTLRFIFFGNASWNLLESSSRLKMHAYLSSLKSLKAKFDEFVPQIRRVYACCALEWCKIKQSVAEIFYFSALVLLPLAFCQGSYDAHATLPEILFVSEGWEMNSWLICLFLDFQDSPVHSVSFLPQPEFQQFGVSTEPWGLVPLSIPPTPEYPHPHWDEGLLGIHLVPSPTRHDSVRTPLVTQWVWQGWHFKTNHFVILGQWESRARWGKCWWRGYGGGELMSGMWESEQWQWAWELQWWRGRDQLSAFETTTVWWESHHGLGTSCEIRYELWIIIHQLIPTSNANNINFMLRFVLFDFVISGIHFPFLRHLGLADCPLSSISREGCQYFENLQSISLSNTSLQDLSQISALNFLPALTELRIGGIPALSELTGKLT